VSVLEGGGGGVPNRQARCVDELKPSYSRLLHRPFRCASGAAMIAGVGKTMTARKLAELFYRLGALPRNHVTCVIASNLEGRYVGQTQDTVCALPLLPFISTSPFERCFAFYEPLCRHVPLCIACHAHCRCDVCLLMQPVASFS
jgi:hypothetical protein